MSNRVASILCFLFAGELILCGLVAMSFAPWLGAWTIAVGGACAVLGWTGR